MSATARLAKPQIPKPPEWALIVTRESPEFVNCGEFAAVAIVVAMVLNKTPRLPHAI